MFQTIMIVGARVKGNMRNELAEPVSEKKQQKEQCPGVEIDSNQMVHRQ